LRDPDAVLSPVVVATTSRAVPLLRAWQETMIESLFDPDLAAPASLRDGVLASLAGNRDVGIEGAATVAGWGEWAALRSRGVPVEDAPPVVDTIELWDLLAATGQRVDGEITDTEDRLVHLRVHDPEPLESLREIVEGTLVDVGDVAEATPFERAVRAIRRASDPMGLRWPSGATGQFESWLYSTNQNGVTRIADLNWYSDPEVRDRFPHARVDPTGYLDWCRGEGRRILGFDLLNRDVLPIIPEARGGSEAPSGLRNAVAWRWNVIKGLVPGVAAAGERREKGNAVVSGPQAGRGTTEPRLIQVDRDPSLWDVSPRSLSLIGCLRAESGLGQAARASLRAIRSLEIPFTYIDTSEQYWSRNSADVGLDRSTFGAAGDVNLIHANAMEILWMNDTVFRDRLGGRFNAAMWFWEAGRLPAWKIDAFDRIDELWVASDYLADVLGQYGKVPIRNVGLAAPLPAARTVDRKGLGISDDEFVYLFVYDAFSSHGRKNPELALQAFIKAFGPDFEGVRFILKASNLNKLPVDRDRLMALAGVTDAITVIDRYLGHEDVYDLMATADVYVSLHAAEGYGLTILEAMSLGTPSICTGYSGNMEFTTPENSWLVDYELIETGQVNGPYPAGALWAKPSLDSAVAAMRDAASHPEKVAAMATMAKETAAEAASLERYANALSKNLRRVM
jgi:glycosyltransferase involved in cell wall biosynthesis